MRRLTIFGYAAFEPGEFVEKLVEERHGGRSGIFGGWAMRGDSRKNAGSFASDPQCY